MEHTEYKISVIQALLSAGKRVVKVESNSIRLGVAERGATAAKPLNSARMIDRPCLWIRRFLASANSSIVAVLVTRVCFEEKYRQSL